MNGSKIQVIKHSNITILDSLNFFSCKLSALPEMFQLNCESKGYFPHFINDCLPQTIGNVTRT